MQDLFDIQTWRTWRGTAPTAVESTLTADAVILANKPSDTIMVQNWRGGRVRVYSNGANNETATLSFYSVESRAQGGYYVNNIGAWAITLGTEVGVAGIPIKPDHRFADVSTGWTPTTFFTGLLTYTGGNSAKVEAAADAIMDLMISDFGNVEMLTWRVTTYGLTATSFIQTDYKLDR